MHVCTLLLAHKEPDMKKAEIETQTRYFRENIETYMERLREIGLSEAETEFEVLEYQNETKILFSVEIIPKNLVEKIRNANETKKYRVSFEPCEDEKVVVTVHGQSLIPFGIGFILYILCQTITMKEGRKLPKRPRKNKTRE